MDSSFDLVFATYNRTLNNSRVFGPKSGLSLLPAHCLFLPPAPSVTILQIPLHLTVNLLSQRKSCP